MPCGCAGKCVVCWCSMQPESLRPRYLDEDKPDRVKRRERILKTLKREAKLRRRRAYVQASER